MADDIRKVKPSFSMRYLISVKNAILARPKVRFGAGFTVTEKDGEILVSISGTSNQADNGQTG